jgi:hypothetical protein
MRSIQLLQPILPSKQPSFGISGDELIQLGTQHQLQFLVSQHPNSTPAQQLYEATVVTGQGGGGLRPVLFTDVTQPDEAQRKVLSKVNGTGDTPNRAIEAIATGLRSGDHAYLRTGVARVRLFTIV